MVIALLAEQHTRAEILEKGISHEAELIWTDSLRSLVMVEADYYFDLKFEMDNERITKLATLLPKPVFIGAVNNTLTTIGHTDFIRINDWPGMINRPIIEIACHDGRQGVVEEFGKRSNWKLSRVSDIEGFVTPRIIAMIINEAYYAAEEGISSREEIDVAMIAGTNYPFGPFKWAEIIGREKVFSLLKSLGRTNNRYQVASSLINEIAGSD
jgi:3-hydroxybutyryl-CoA dehydrogenase